MVQFACIGEVPYQRQVGLQELGRAAEGQRLLGRLETARRDQIAAARRALEAHAPARALIAGASARAPRKGVEAADRASCFAAPTPACLLDGALAAALTAGDVVVDGGNSNYKDSVRRAATLKETGLAFLDAGTSGGIWGLKEGYSLMIGGDADAFAWPTSHAEARAGLRQFLEERFAEFGPYEDAISAEHPFVFHALLTPGLNIGLLDPRDVLADALDAGEEVPLASLEGFVRQLIGWREYMRATYVLWGRRMRSRNHLGHTRPLAEGWWTAETGLDPVDLVLRRVLEHGYAHHIERLMVLGNFCLIAGISPREVQDWYLVVYADAYEWVELPNVHGMVMHADGGRLGSKPYAASGSYISRMSDYCGACSYDLKQKTGADACPFNYLYWNFLIENEAALGDNQRMGLMFANLRKKDKAERDRITGSAKAFLDGEEWP